jgi:hypothetical protein
LNVPLRVPTAIAKSEICTGGFSATPNVFYEATRWRPFSSVSLKAKTSGRLGYAAKMMIGSEAQ